MEILERIVVGAVFGIPGVLIMGYNFYRIFAKTKTASPAYLLGGLLASVGVLAIFGSSWKDKWYIILIPFAIDVAFTIVSFIKSFMHK